MPIDHLAESKKLIFVMNRLDDGIRVSMPLQIIKCIQMHAVEAF